MGRVFTGQASYSFEEILLKVPVNLSAYEQEALHFCRQWLSGQEIFTLHTSGSTGIPKAITLHRSQMEASAKATRDVLDLRAGDRSLVCLNTNYIAGIMMLVRGMVTDMDMYLVAPSSNPFRNLSPDFYPDFTALVPLQMETLLDEQMGQDIERLNRMKSILIGGAAVSDKMEEKIQRLKVPVYHTYGMTETVSHIALRRMNGNEKEDIFRVMPQVKIRSDVRGCLEINSPVTLHQWVTTNDLVEIKDEQCFQWIGRADYIINSGGIKIQPEKIESIIRLQLEKSGINSFVIIGLPHPALGEAVTLFIVDAQVNQELLLQSLVPLISRFELPKAVIGLSSFPLTETGKINRNELRERFRNYYQ